MRSRNSEKGAVVLEAAMILPALLVFVMLFVYLINLFIVQMAVQYALNQTVNEIGNYTYVLDFFGAIDGINDVKDNLAEKSASFRGDINNLFDTYDSVMNFVGDTGEFSNKAKNQDINFSDIDSYADSISGTADDLKSGWNTIKGYVDDPSKLVKGLVSQAGVEGIKAATRLLGGLLGKAMMYNYVDDNFLKSCGVVSTSYNIGNQNCLSGIDGMDFSKSSLLSDTKTDGGKADSRVIDIIVVYRVKFPFNIGAIVPGLKEGDTLYDNSLLIVQRAAGYGWINGDGSRGAKKYNESKSK